MVSPQAKVAALALSMLMSIFSGVVFYGNNNDDINTPVVGLKDGFLIEKQVPVPAQHKHEYEPDQQHHRQQPQQLQQHTQHVLKGAEEQRLGQPRREEAPNGDEHERDVVVDENEKRFERQVEEGEEIVQKLRQSLDLSRQQVAEREKEMLLLSEEHAATKGDVVDMEGRLQMQANQLLELRQQIASHDEAQRRLRQEQVVQLQEREQELRQLQGHQQLQQDRLGDSATSWSFLARALPDVPASLLVPIATLRTVPFVKLFISAVQDWVLPYLSPIDVVLLLWFLVGWARKRRTADDDTPHAPVAVTNAPSGGDDRFLQQRQQMKEERKTLNRTIDSLRTEIKGEKEATKTASKERKAMDEELQKERESVEKLQAELKSERDARVVLLREREECDQLVNEVKERMSKEKEEFETVVGKVREKMEAGKKTIAGLKADRKAREDEIATERKAERSLVEAVGVEMERLKAEKNKSDETIRRLEERVENGDAVAKVNHTSVVEERLREREDEMRSLVERVTNEKEEEKRAREQLERVLEEESRATEEEREETRRREAEAEAERQKKESEIEGERERMRESERGMDEEMVRVEAEREKERKEAMEHVTALTKEVEELKRERTEGERREEERAAREDAAGALREDGEMEREKARQEIDALLRKVQTLQEKLEERERRVDSERATQMEKEESMKAERTEWERERTEWVREREMGNGKASDVEAGRQEEEERLHKRIASLEASLSSMTQQLKESGERERTMKGNFQEMMDIRDEMNEEKKQHETKMRRLSLESPTPPRRLRSASLSEAAGVPAVSSDSTSASSSSSSSSSPPVRRRPGSRSPNLSITTTTTGALTPAPSAMASSTKTGPPTASTASKRSSSTTSASTDSSLLSPGQSPATVRAASSPSPSTRRNSFRRRSKNHGVTTDMTMGQLSILSEVDFDSLNLEVGDDDDVANEDYNDHAAGGATTTITAPSDDPANSAGGVGGGIGGSGNGGRADVGGYLGGGGDRRLSATYSPQLQSAAMGALAGTGALRIASPRRNSVSPTPRKLSGASPPSFPIATSDSADAAALSSPPRNTVVPAALGDGPSADSSGAVVDGNSSSAGAEASSTLKKHLGEALVTLTGMVNSKANEDDDNSSSVGNQREAGVGDTDEGEAEDLPLALKQELLAGLDVLNAIESMLDEFEREKKKQVLANAGKLLRQTTPKLKEFTRHACSNKDGNMALVVQFKTKLMRLVKRAKLLAARTRSDSGSSPSQVRARAEGVPATEEGVADPPPQTGTADETVDVDVGVDVVVEDPIVKEDEMRAKKERVRLAVLREFLKTESDYIDSLSTLQTSYLVPLAEWKKEDQGYAFLRQQVSELLLTLRSCVSKINTQLSDDISKSMGSDLRSASDDQVRSLQLGLVLKDVAPFLKLYNSYVTAYHGMLETLVSLENDKDFTDYLKELHASSGIGLHLNSLLVMPVQRVPRYELLVKELLKHTPAEFSDSSALQSAYDNIHKVNMNINETRRKCEGLEKVSQLQRRLTGYSSASLVKPSRVWVREGAMRVRATGESDSKPFYCFLFSDLIIITTPTKESGWKGLDYDPSQESSLSFLFSSGDTGNGNNSPARHSSKPRTSSRTNLSRDALSPRGSSSPFGGGGVRSDYQYIKTIPLLFAEVEVDDDDDSESTEFTIIMSPPSSTTFTLCARDVSTRHQWQKDVLDMLDKMKDVRLPANATDPFAADASAPSRYDGFLLKLGEKGLIKTWKRRHFVLRGMTLFYYDGVGGEEKGHIPLRWYTVERTTQRGKLNFRLIDHEQPERRVYELQAENEEDLEVWCNLIKANTEFVKHYANKLR